MEKKKVLFISSWFPNRLNPFLGNFNERTAESVSILNDVYVLDVVADENMQGSPEFVWMEKEGYKQLTIYFPKPNNKNVLSSFLKKIKFFKLARLGFREIQKEWGTPDLVHLNVLYPMGVFAYYLKKRYGISFIASEHWTGFLNLDKKTFIGARKRWTLRIAKEASVICPVTLHLQHAMLNYGIQANYQVVPNVINPKVFFPSLEKVVTEGTRFLHVSTGDDHHKNISGIIRVMGRVFGQFKNARLHMISEGDLMELHSLAAKVDPNYADFLLISGPQSQVSIAEEMRRSDCFVLFSNFETFSVVIAEAWSCGLPVIYSKCGGLTEINHPNLGIQIERRDEQALFESMISFCRNDQVFDPSEMTKFAQQFHPSTVAKMFTEIYRESD